ncbi:MAG: DUF484 family protein [Rhodobacteraceae bacterium]|uniref:DUF484 family protein n=1 Tax=Amaricoccus sp. B4 TaxID=3368557 RepID=UPI000DAC360E|nr:DUF484 family protein [Paracoccaceae bacterium]
MIDESGITDIQEIRDRILEDPGLILDDPDLMRGLLKADRRAAGRNVVDLRGVLVERLEERLDRLEDTHREVLAAAYENVAGTNQIHRACLAVLDAEDFAGFLRLMTGDLGNTLSVDTVRLGLEAPAAEPGAGLGPEGPLRHAVIALPEGGADTYVTHGRGLGAPRKVTLRQLAKASPDLYGERAPLIRSEAVLRLDLGPGRHGGLLVFGATEPDRFHSDQGTDLLTFFCGVFERALRRFIA